MSANAPAIVIDRVAKRFGTVQAVADLSFDIPAGSFFALLGPSGCGKTTAMRLIAGFETPDAGSIRIDGVDMADVSPERRPVNMMFQSYALFPHMSVAGNIGYGLRRAGLSRANVAEGVSAMLRLVQLDDFGDRKPDQLSGGQRQRVALARALARKPKILLLDEPMAALDRKLREETQFVLKDIRRQLGTTFLVVTHDQDEAFGLADKVALMREGRIEQIGSPADLYTKPATRFVARFIGETNVIEGKVRAIDDGVVVVDTVDGPIAAFAHRRCEIGAKVAAAIRPENFSITDNEKARDGTGATFTGEIHDLTFRGALVLARVRLASSALLRVALPSGTCVTTGEAITVHAAEENIRILDD